MINRELITALVATNHAIRYELSSLFLSLFNIHTRARKYTYIYYTSSKRIQDDHHRPASSLSSSKFSRFVRSCRRFVSWIAVAKSLSFVSRLGDWLITNKLSSAVSLWEWSQSLFSEKVHFSKESPTIEIVCVSTSFDAPLIFLLFLLILLLSFSHDLIFLLFSAGTSGATVFRLISQSRSRSSLSIGWLTPL